MIGWYPPSPHDGWFFDVFRPDPCTPISHSQKVLKFWWLSSPVIIVVMIMFMIRIVDDDNRWPLGSKDSSEVRTQDHSVLWVEKFSNYSMHGTQKILLWEIHMKNVSSINQCKMKFSWYLEFSCLVHEIYTLCNKSPWNLLGKYWMLEVLRPIWATTSSFGPFQIQENWRMVYYFVHFPMCSQTCTIPELAAARYFSKAMKFVLTFAVLISTKLQWKWKFWWF